MEVIRGDGFYMEWYGSEVEQEILDTAKKNLAKAGEYLANKIRQNISGRKRSKAGEYPGSKSGQLARSIKSQVEEDGMVVLVGSNEPYALYLEMGTQGGKTIWANPGQVFSWIDDSGMRVYSKKITLGAIRGRSYIRRTFNKERRQLANIIEGGAGSIV